MDQEMGNDNEATDWPALSADLNLARATARTITLDTQRASEDGRILEVTSQLELVRTRLSSLERHVFDATAGGSVPDDLLERLAALDTDLAETASQFHGLAGRVASAEEHIATTMLSSVDGFDTRLNVVEDARLAQTKELNELTTYLEQAFTRIAELATVIDNERGANANFRAENFNQLTDLGTDVTTKMEQLDAAISALSSRVDDATESIDASTATATTALEASVADLEGRMNAAEARLGNTDEVSTSIQFLTARAEALEEAQINTSGNIIENVERAHARIDEAVSTTSVAHERVDAAEQRISTAESQLEELLDHAASSTPDSASSAEVQSVRADLDTVSTRVDSITEDADVIKADIDNVKNVVDGQAEITSANSEKLASLDETIQSLEGSRDSQNTVLETHSEILDATTGLLAEHSGLLAESQESIAAYNAQMESHAAAVAEALELAEAANQAAHVASERIDTTSGVASDEVQDQVDAASQRLDTVDSTIDGLTEQVTNAATAIDAAHARIDETESAVFGASSQLDSYRSETDAKITDVTHELHTRIDSAFGKIDQLEHDQDAGVDDDLASTVEQVAGRVDDNAGQIDQLREQADAKDARIGEAHERISASESRIGEAHDRINTTNAVVDDAHERINTTDARVDDAHERISTSAQQAYNTIERVDAVDDRVTETNERVGSLEQQVNALESTVGDAITAANNDAQSETAESIHSLGDQIADMRDAAGANAQRVDAVESQLGDLDNATGELREHVVALASQIEQQDQPAAIDPQELQQINERLDATDSQISSIGENVSTVTTQIDTVTTQIEEVTAQIDQATHQNGEANESLRQSLFSRIEDTEGRLAERISSIEANANTQSAVVDDARLDALSASVTQAEESAREAQSFSENLRLLQADLVQAIQSEMRTQSDEIDQHTALLAELRSAADGDNASAERVQVLEAKIGEALQSISQLTQLQRRNTTVETQLTDTLVATSQGVEHTQQHVIALRGELETALGRIARLESMIASLQAAPAAAPATAVSPEAVAAPPTDADDDDADTGWFTESYARKNAS